MTHAAAPIAAQAVLITGAGRNIGRQMALAFSQAGFAVAVHVRTSRAAGEAVVAEIRAAGGQALLCVADVTDPDAVQRMMGEIEAAWGRLDVVVNNAAVRQEAPVSDITPQAWRQALAVVLDGAFFCTQAALPLLRRSPEAAVVNIGGLTGHTGAPNRVHVVTAKAGLAGMTRALAHDLAADGITVNCVAPGLIDTVRHAGSASADPAHRAHRQTLVGRRGRSEEVADAVLWLAGPQARFVTGQVLHVNGGAYLGG